MFRGRVEEYRLHTPFASFPLHSPPPPLLHRVTSDLNWALPSTSNSATQSKATQIYDEQIQKHWRLGKACPETGYEGAGVE
jgi:hypothetical protein